MKTGSYTVSKSHHERLAELGGRIRKARVKLRLTQRKMAAALNTSASYLSEIECGKANPGPGFFLDLSVVYNISIEYIFHGEGEMFYDQDTRLPRAEFKAIHEIDSMEKLFWVMNQSFTFKHTLLGFASRYYLENEAIIKKSMKKDVS